MPGFKLGRFGSIVATLVVIYAFIKLAIPAISRQITGMDEFPLTVPGTLVFFYMTLAVVAMYMLTNFSDEILVEFLAPIKKLLRGGYGVPARTFTLIAVPLVIAWQTYEVTVPKSELPAALRIQHPSSNFPEKFEAYQNPFENPSAADLAAFMDQVREGVPVLIPQVEADFQYWQDEHPDSHWLEAIGTGPVNVFLKERESGSPGPEAIAGAYREVRLFEGRALYAMNCRPCHGDSATGDGPMADGFKLRPINFTDNGTIETIVEGYTFWRVATGGQALPTEATPWDSAMPQWDLNLSEDDRWRIIMAEYDLAEKTPRIPESHE